MTSAERAAKPTITYEVLLEDVKAHGKISASVQEGRYERPPRYFPKKDAWRILKRIEMLAEDPRPDGCEKLTDQERYRFRQGSYRIIYEVQDDDRVVVVVKISHRKDVCRP